MDHLDADFPTELDHDDERAPVTVETETGLLMYVPGEPDAWIHTDAPADLE